MAVALAAVLRTFAGVLKCENGTLMLSEIAAQIGSPRQWNW
jgi:hypothetical protein